MKGFNSSVVPRSVTPTHRHRARDQVQIENWSVRRDDDKENMIEGYEGSMDAEIEVLASCFGLKGQQMKTCVARILKNGRAL